ncbi:methyltransferase domain-containing protein [Sorangium sp. So ce134]
MVKLDDVQTLACPTCRGALAHDGPPAQGRLERGSLACAGCGARWPIEDGLARLYREQDVRGTDKLMRYIYDGLPALHNPGVRYLLPVLQLGGSEGALRDAYIERLELGSLRPRPDGRPIRVLEVGMGAGANLPLLYRALPRGLDVEIWGPDLSRGMLRVGRRIADRLGRGDVRTLLADAHALPFPDRAFDRVFHVGGISGFRDPARALAEMARVAAPGTPIVVVDEQLTPELRKSLYHRLTFKLITFYDPDPHCPRELVPREAVDVLEEQISPFYYCLRFRMPLPG